MGLVPKKKRWAFRPLRLAQSLIVADLSARCFPFGAGPRACIGGQLAIMQAVSTLAAVLARFDIAFQRRSADLTDVDLRPGISLWPKQPLLVQVSAI